MIIYLSFYLSIDLYLGMSIRDPAVAPIVASNLNPPHPVVLQQPPPSLHVTPGTSTWTASSQPTTLRMLRKRRLRVIVDI